MPLFRSTFQALADMRKREARILLKAKQYGGAFHIAGLAVECGIKACIAKRNRRYEFPDLEFVRECYRHDAIALIKSAELLTPLQADMKVNPQLKAHWGTVCLWKVDARYSTKKTKAEAVDLCNAIDDPREGILTWIRARW